MPATKLICFCGAGGTGKTTILNHLREFDEITVHGSIVRQFYAMKGIASEIQFSTLSTMGKVKFQKELNRYYLDTLIEAIDSCSTEYLACDRSIFDHVAYAIYSGQGMLGRDDIDYLDELAYEFTSIKGVITTVAYFPYPAPWITSGQTEDDFRHVDTVKDTIIDALMYRYFKRYETPTVHSWVHMLRTDVFSRLTQLMAVTGLGHHGDKLRSLLSSGTR